jgi:hypothetical protein
LAGAFALADDRSLIDWYDVVVVDTFGGGYLRSTQNCWPRENRFVVTQYMTTPMGNSPPEISSENGMP